MDSSPAGQPPDVASGPSLVDETVRALNGYYGRLGRIGLDLARAVVPVEGLHLPSGPIRIDLSSLLRALRRAAGGDGSGVPAGALSAVAESPTLLVEADGDRPGFGVFLVENLTAEPVSAAITVSAFVDEQGHEVRPRLLLRPATVSLEPGQQAMVQLAAELDAALEPGVRYRGVIAIPGLSDRRIPVVLRRVAAPDGAASTVTSPAPDGAASAVTSPAPDEHASAAAAAAVSATPVAASALSATMPRRRKAVPGAVAEAPTAPGRRKAARAGKPADDEPRAAATTESAPTAAPVRPRRATVSAPAATDPTATRTASSAPARRRRTTSKATPPR